MSAPSGDGRGAGPQRAGSRGAGLWGDALARSLATAVARRQVVELGEAAGTTIHRLVHGAADGCPGVIVDRLGHVANLRLRPELLQEGVPGPGWWLEQLAGAGVTHAWLTVDEPRKDLQPAWSHVEARWREELAQLGALAPPSWTATELGLRYELSSTDGFSYGIFTDMRPVRATLRARWRGRRVANLFAYTGAFGVVLAEHNEVHNVDVSRQYLDHGERNLALNGLEGRARSVRADAFDFLEQAARRGLRWDGLVLDPPVFSHGKKGLSRRFTLTRDFDRLLDLAVSVLAPGGELMVSTNLAAMTQAEFDARLSGVAPVHGATIEERFRPAVDYPVSAAEWHLKAALVRRR